MLGMATLEALTPRGFSLGERTLENRELKWSHSLSGTQFDTLPDLVAVGVQLTYWHCLKATGHTLAGTILVPKSANSIELIQMHRWKHPYVAMKSYLQRMTVYNETRYTRGHGACRWGAGGTHSGPGNGRWAPLHSTRNNGSSLDSC